MAPLTGCCYSCRGTGPSLSSGPSTRPSPAPDVQRVGRQPRCRSTHPTRPSRSGNPAALLRVTCPWDLCQRLDLLWCWPRQTRSSTVQAAGIRVQSRSSRCLPRPARSVCDLCATWGVELGMRVRHIRAVRASPGCARWSMAGDSGRSGKGSAPAAGTRQSRRGADSRVNQPQGVRNLGAD